MMKLNRRTLLRGTVGGALVTVGLPPLEAFFDSHGVAYADGAIPRRFGLYYWGNGIHPERWTPATIGRDWTPPDQLEPLAALRDELTVVTGMSVLTGNVIPHGSGPAGILTGSPAIVRGQEYTMAGPTVDQVIAQEIGGETRFRSLEVGVRPGPGLSFNGPDSVNPPESSPHALFTRVFGGGFQAPGSEPRVDPKLRLRRSVLDGVMADSARLKQRLGAGDQRRLDQHLDGVRELEKRLARLEESPASLAACAVPPEPALDYPAVDGRQPLSDVSRAIADVLVMALACDQTRVFSSFFSAPINNLLFPGASAGHHQLTHDEPGDQPAVNAIVKQIMVELAYFLEKLRAVQEGDRTLLDNCVVLCTSDVSFPREHRLDEYPVLLAGTASGALQKGLHVRSTTGDNVSKVILTLLRAMGVRRAEWGTEEGRVTEGLGAIEA